MKYLLPLIMLITCGTFAQDETPEPRENDLKRIRLTKPVKRERTVNRLEILSLQVDSFGFGEIRIEIAEGDGVSQQMREPVILSRKDLERGLVKAGLKPSQATLMLNRFAKVLQALTLEKLGFDARNIEDD